MPRPGSASGSGRSRGSPQATSTSRTPASHHRIKAGRRQGFAHTHERAEEIYVVLGGSGRVKLDDDIVELRRLDAVRVSPGVLRTREAGPDGLELLAFGSRVEGDAELAQPCRRGRRL